MSADTGVTITLKTEHSQGGPWVVLKGEDGPHALDLLRSLFPGAATAAEADNPHGADFAQIVHEAQVHFNAVANAVYTEAPGVTRFQVPTQRTATEAAPRPDFVSPSAPTMAAPAAGAKFYSKARVQPTAPPPQCPHGEMQWVAPAGKEWKGWFCSADQNDPNKCQKPASPQFVR